MNDEDWNSLPDDLVALLERWVHAENEAWKHRLEVVVKWGGVMPEVMAEAYRRFGNGL